MAAESVLLDRDERGVATLTLNRPDLHNAFDDGLICALQERLVALDADPAVRVVRLAANGKSFSAGADLNWMRRVAAQSEPENLRDARALTAMLATLDRLSKPTVALVHGAAFGGGVGLVCCCDIALATPRASFCLSEVKLGIIPAAISPYVVSAMGRRAARRYLLTAERFDAERALALGLVHEIVAEAELAAAAERVTCVLLANAPRAMAECKQLLRAVAQRPLDDELIEETARRIARIRTTDEAREGLAAFLEKRDPDWRR